MDLFDRQWSSYRAIVEHNLMEHRQVADATADALQGWLRRVAEKTRADPNFTFLRKGAR